MYRHNSTWLLPGLILVSVFSTSRLFAQESVVVSDMPVVRDTVIFSDQVISEVPIVGSEVTIFGSPAIFASPTIVGSPIVEHVIGPVPTTSPQPAPPIAINWVHKYGIARRAGTKKQKPVMLFLTMDGCLHCTRMEHTVFSDSKIVTRLNQKFVPARVKLETKSKLAQDLKVTVFPTTVFIAPDGKILDYVRGYMPSQKFRHRMDLVSKEQTASLHKLAK